MTNCIQCDLLLPEMDRQISVLRKENSKLRMMDDPMNPGHRSRFSEMEKSVSELTQQIEQFELVLYRALKLLKDAEPSGHIYVDTYKRGAWRTEQKELLQALVEE